MNYADLIRRHQWIEYKAMAHIVPNVTDGTTECGSSHHGRLLMTLRGNALINTRLCQFCVQAVAPDLKGGTVAELTGVKS